MPGDSASNRPLAVEHADVDCRLALDFLLQASSCSACPRAASCASIALRCGETDRPRDPDWSPAPSTARPWPTAPSKARTGVPEGEPSGQRKRAGGRRARPILAAIFQDIADSPHRVDQLVLVGIVDLRTQTAARARPPRWCRSQSSYPTPSPRSASAKAPRRRRRASSDTSKNSLGVRSNRLPGSLAL